MTHPPGPGDGTRKDVPRERPRRSLGPVTTSKAGDVEVLRLSELWGDSVDEVVRHLSMAFAEASRAVVVALPEDAGAEAGAGADGPAGTARESSARAALSLLDAAAELAGGWQGVPIVVACPSAPLRERLEPHAPGPCVVVTGSLPQALTTVLGTAPPPSSSRDLSPHPTSPRAARDLVSRALLDWHLLDRLPAAALVTSELVTNAMLHARTHMRLRVCAHDRTVRISVSDGVPDMVSVARRAPVTPDRREAGERAGRGLAVVAALSHRWGVLPTPTGGKSVWALLGDSRAGTPSGP